MMQPYSANQQTFHSLSPEALAFYRRHGFVVLPGLFDSEEIGRFDAGFQTMLARMAGEMNQPPDEYARIINQWRDLWKSEPVFDALMRDERMHGAAQFFMEEECVQLLHDHIISKPCEAKPAGSHTNQQLPWHQDYPFWPVNTPGSLSLWMPFADVAEQGGCLEVVDGSHQWGASEPVDFIMEDPERFANRDDISLVRIPARSGALVVLHSLTWHRSHPNRHSGSKRHAYITLWIPAHAQYQPDTRKWHPLNDNITVAAGETLNTDHFPRFGEYRDDPGTRRRRVDVVNEPRTKDAPMDMFEAAARIAGQMHELLLRSGIKSEPRRLQDYVADADLRRQILQSAADNGLIEDAQKGELDELLRAIHASSMAYTKHRARNVFNSGYAGWWNLVGKKLRTTETTRPQ